MTKRLLQLIGIILGFIIIGSVVTSLTFGTAELKKEMREEQALAEDQNRTLLSATEEVFYQYMRMKARQRQRKRNYVWNIRKYLLRKIKGQY